MLEGAFSEEGSEDPLRGLVEEALKSSFGGAHGFTVPSTWLGTPSLVGRLYREYQKSLSHTAIRLERVKSVKQCMENGLSEKRQRISSEVELVTNLPITARARAAYQYLLSLQTLMFSLCAMQEPPRIGTTLRHLELGKPSRHLPPHSFGKARRDSAL